MNKWIALSLTWHSETLITYRVTYMYTYHNIWAEEVRVGIKVDECYALERQLLGANGPVDQWQRFIMILHNVDRQLGSHASQHAHLT